MPPCLVGECAGRVSGGSALAWGNPMECPRGQNKEGGRNAYRAPAGNPGTDRPDPDSGARRSRCSGRTCASGYGLASRSALPLQEGHSTKRVHDAVRVVAGGGDTLRAGLQHRYRKSEHVVVGAVSGARGRDLDRGLHGVAWRVRPHHSGVCFRSDGP